LIALDNEDRVRGDAAAATVVDYTLHGLVGTTITQLADGQLPVAIGDLYTAGEAGIAVTSIILVNTDASARAVNLYLTPSDGTARRLIPKDMSLGAGHALITDGIRVSVYDTSGNLTTVAVVGAHKDSHDPEDGIDPLDTAVPVKVRDANAEGDAHSFARSNHVHEKHHTKYTDAEAVAAANAAGLALASGKNIKVISALISDHTWSGLSAVMTAGEAIEKPKLCRMSDNGKLLIADKDSAVGAKVIVLATADVAQNADSEFLLQGFYRDDTWNWTLGGLLYLGDSGAMVQDVSGYTTGDQVQVVGVAFTADIIYFNPSLELVEIS